MHQQEVKWYESFPQPTFLGAFQIIPYPQLTVHSSTRICFSRIESIERNKVSSTSPRRKLSLGFVPQNFWMFVRCNTRRCESTLHDTLLHKGLRQRDSLTLRRNGASARRARDKHGGLMNYISLNFCSMFRSFFHRFLQIEALSHQCSTTTPEETTLVRDFSHVASGIFSSLHFLHRCVYRFVFSKF